jgi:hypothetical protein
MEDADRAEFIGRLDKLERVLRSPLEMAQSLQGLLYKKQLTVAAAVCAGLIAVIEAIPDQ